MRLWILALLHLGDAFDQFGKCLGDHTEVEECDSGMCAQEVCTDCAWGEWSDYGPCTCEGIQDRHRVIVQSNTICGKPCAGPKVETKRCQPECHAAPKDCLLSDWAEWSECDKTCDKGQQFRERTVLENLAGNGEPCDGYLKETRSCKQQSCSGSGVDCKLSPWGPWTKCSEKCNGGQQQRERSVITSSAHGGEPCEDPIIELRGCNDHACAQSVNCVWGQWVEWSACSKTCDGGEKSRSRLIDTAPRNGGKLCDPHAMSEVAACNTEPCHAARDCEFTVWSEWSDCSCSCKGTRARTRHVSTYSENGGRSCDGSLKSVEPCNVDSCGPHVPHELQEEPADCVFSAYTPYSECSATCGTGQKSRTRRIESVAKHGGKPCDGELSNIMGCNEEPCKEHHAINLEHAPVNCEWEMWGEWGACSASCDGGLRQRQRAIKQMANHFGTACEKQVSIEADACSTQGCGCQDCEWSPWAEWGACTCTGLRERHRNILTHYATCGKPCIGAKAMTQECQPDCGHKAVDCELSDWSLWSDCSKDCGGGQQYRTKKVLQQASNGGRACNGDLKEIQPCNQGHCNIATDCLLAEWDEWSKCSATCGGGQQFRHRTIETPSQHMGKGCIDELAEIRGCGQADCEASTDCEWDEWTEWSACSSSCGSGQKTRDRSIKIAPRRGGKLCDPLDKSEVAACKETECGGGCIDGEWGPWSDFGLCSASCGKGYQSRNRIKAHNANHCGKALEGPMQEYQECNNIPCDVGKVDCEFGLWSEWGDCSCSCNGIRDRSRQVVEYGRNFGKACRGALKEVEACNTDVCKALEKPEHCVMSEWSEWGRCSVKCGGGLMKRSRVVTSPPQHGGNPCQGGLKEVDKCNYQSCEHTVDCMWGEWAEWDTCTADCGGGQRTRYRHINIMPSHGGEPCETKGNVHVEGCNPQPCGKVLYCSWTSWATWTPCSAKCGKGQRRRQRHMQKGAEKPVDGYLDSGMLDLQQEVDLKKRFSLEDLGMVFLCGMVFTSVAFVGSVTWSRRSRHSPEIGHVPLLEQEMDVE